jgi:DnaJ-domain-containing protein 1
MNRYIGRVFGAVAGLPAGPAGLMFGFLIGSLVDQYRNSRGDDRKLQRYLGRPELERHPGRAAVYATAVFMTHLIGTAETDRINFAVSLPWPGDERDDAPDRVVQLRRRRYIQRVSARYPRDDFSIYLSDLVRRKQTGSDTDMHLLLDTLTRVGCFARKGMDSDQRRIIRKIGRAWGVDDLYLVGLEARYGSLDRDACKILGLSSTSTRDELKRVYRRLAANLHPDGNAVLEVYQQQELEEVFLRIRGAYDRLSSQLDEREETR